MIALFWQEAQHHWRGLIELIGWCAVVYWVVYVACGLLLWAYRRRAK